MYRYRDWTIIVCKDLPIANALFPFFSPYFFLKSSLFIYLFIYFVDTSKDMIKHLLKLFWQVLVVLIYHDSIVGLDLMYKVLLDEKLNFDIPLVRGL